MAKRFTDTNKFDDPWYFDLSNEAKLVWEYVLSKCDNAGVWEPNFKLANACIKGVDWGGVLREFEGRIIVLESGKWWAWKFVEFQYGELSLACKPHMNVIKILRQHGLYESLLELQIKGHPKGIDTLQEKEKEKDKEKDKEKVDGGAGEEELSLASELAPRRDLNSEAESIYNAYPRKIGKHEALKAIKRALKTHSAEALLAAASRYSIACAGQDPQFTPYPATWFNRGSYEDDPASWSAFRPVTEASRDEQKTGLTQTFNVPIR